MLYNTLITTLTVLGVLGTVVYSRKIARSRVYVVGLLRESNKVESSTAANSSVSVVVDENGIPTQLTPVSEFETKGISAEKRWQCGKCGLVEEIEEFGEQFRCSHCGGVVHRATSETPTRIDKVALVELKQAELQKDLSEHEDVLDEHSKMLVVIERRLRQIELESVHKIQELPDERVFVDRQQVVN